MENKQRTHWINTKNVDKTDWIFHVAHIQTRQRGHRVERQIWNGWPSPSTRLASTTPRLTTTYNQWKNDEAWQKEMDAKQAGRTAGIVIGVLAMVICIIVVPLACICRDRCKRKRESQAAPRRSSEPAPPVNLWGDAPEPTRAYTRNDELGILTRAERNRRIMQELEDNPSPEAQIYQDVAAEMAMFRRGIVPARLRGATYPTQEDLDVFNQNVSNTDLYGLRENRSGQGSNPTARPANPPTNQTGHHHQDMDVNGPVPTAPNANELPADSAPPPAYNEEMMPPPYDQAIDSDVYIRPSYPRQSLSSCNNHNAYMTDDYPEEDLPPYDPSYTNDLTQSTAPRSETPAGVNNPHNAQVDISSASSEDSVFEADILPNNTFGNDIQVNTNHMALRDQRIPSDNVAIVNPFNIVREPSCPESQESVDNVTHVDYNSGSHCGTPLTQSVFDTHGETPSVQNIPNMYGTHHGYGSSEQSPNNDETLHTTSERTYVQHHRPHQIVHPDAHDIKQRQSSAVHCNIECLHHLPHSALAHSDLQDEHQRSPHTLASNIDGIHHIPPQTVHSGIHDEHHVPADISEGNFEFQTVGLTQDETRSHEDDSFNESWV